MEKTGQGTGKELKPVRDRGKESKPETGRDKRRELKPEAGKDRGRESKPETGKDRGRESKPETGKDKRKETGDRDCNARAVVLELLLKQERGQEYSNRLIKGTLDKYDFLSVQDKAFIKRLFEGCVERKLQLDYVINRFSKTPVSKMKPVILLTLRMGVYQILHMDAVPDSAACNESVKLAAKKGFSGLKGYVNGVLRSVGREKNRISWPSVSGPEGAVRALSVRYSMPEWIVGQFLEDYGEKTTEAMLEAFLTEQPVTVRMDERLTQEEKALWCGRVEEAGIIMKRHELLPYAYRLSGLPGLLKVPGFSEGIFQVQDVSSMLVSEIAGIREGMVILDVCAAPGGKSLHAACKLRGTGLVSARDLTESKAELIRENAMRGNYENLEILVQDARELISGDRERADIVYVDAPCSGLGIMGKKCDIRYRMTPEQTEEICSLQREILDTAWQYVKKDGILIYSTCTIRKAENEDQVEYLKEKGFAAESLNPYLPEKLWNEDTKRGFLQLLPGVHDTDGFFMARLRRT